MPRLFSTSEAARIAGVVASSVRNYTRDPRFSDHFSEQAQPTGNKARQFTANDVKLLCFIGEQPAGVPLDAIAENLSEKLAAYEWTLEEAQRQADNRPRKARNSPKTGPGAQQQQQAEQEGAPAPLAILERMTIVMQTQFAAAREREAELQAQLIDAERRATRAEAQLAALQEQRSQSLWARLFRR